MNRDQQFLAVAAEAISEVSAIVRESNERAGSVPPHADLSRHIRELSQIPRDSAGRPLKDDASKETLASIERCLERGVVSAHAAVQAAYRLGVMDGLIQMAKVGAQERE